MNLKYLRRGLLVTMLFVFGGIAAAEENATVWQDLDYQRTIKSDSMVFIPLKRLDRGAFWFTEYQHHASQPSMFRGLRRLTISLRPRAYDDGRYEAFLSSRHVEDLRVLLKTGDHPCEVTMELMTLTAGSPYAPNFMGNSYPNLCTAVITYDPSREAEVLALVASQKALSARLDVPLCASTSPTIRSAAIMDQLVGQGAVSPTEQPGQWSGRLARTLRGLQEIFSTDRSLSEDGADRALELFWSTHIAGMTQGSGGCDGRVCVTIESKPELDPLYVCAPDPLVVRVGH